MPPSLRLRKHVPFGERLHRFFHLGREGLGEIGSSPGNVNFRKKDHCEKISGREHTAESQDGLDFVRNDKFILRRDVGASDRFRDMKKPRSSWHNYPLS